MMLSVEFDGAEADTSFAAALLLDFAGRADKLIAIKIIIKPKCYRPAMRRQFHQNAHKVLPVAKAREWSFQQRAALSWS